MKPPLGFDTERHARYVASGMCPFVDYKTYCNGQVNHQGTHWALYEEGPRKVKKVVLTGAVVYD